LFYEEVTMPRTHRHAHASPKNRFAHLRPEDLGDAEQTSIIGLAFAILAARHAPGKTLAGPQDTRCYLQLALQGYKNEVFAALFVDNRHRVLAFEVLFFGTIDGTAVYPRVIVQRALELNAAAVILTHNHPSGVAEPSRADEILTQRLKEALALVDVRVLDHFIVTSIETISFAERGLL
jgi:DNA repair protein RadC